LLNDQLCEIFQDILLLLQFNSFERMEVHYVYIYKDNTMKPTKLCLKERREEEGGWTYNEGGELFTHVQNYLSEIPAYC
jgi:hypothetical protein